jgi:hypothetical protein
MDAEITRTRLRQQLITRQPFYTAEEVVSWLGAVQAQDYLAAKWAVGLRTPGLNDAAIHQAVCDGAILRTHVLRPTWHFVTPADIRWMVALTAPRVRLALTANDRRLNIDEAFLARAYDLLTAAMQGGRQLTRAEISPLLRQAGIALDPQLRLGQIMIHAELDGLVCSGAWRGKQATYALLDERVPAAKTRSREESLVGLTRRYFTSRGPATLRDFSWWSGLTVADAKEGLALTGDGLTAETVGGQTYWLAADVEDTPGDPPGALLLPNYDEYAVGYADRRAIIDPAHLPLLDKRSSSLLSNIMVSGGRVIGMWKREFHKGAVTLSTRPFAPQSQAESQAFGAAAARYAHFLGLPLEIIP